MQLGFPTTGSGSNSLCPIELKATSWPEGRRIDLTWKNPVDSTFVVIKRSPVFHPYLVNDPSELLYVGKPIEHFIDGVIVEETVGHPGLKQFPSDLDAGVFNTGEPLEENAFYYYTVFITKAPTPIGVLDFGPFARACMQVTGLSGEDIRQSTRAGYFREWLYRKSPGNAVVEDQKLAKLQGRDTGFWQDVTRFQQGAISLYRNYINNVHTSAIYDNGCPGYVGVAHDQVATIAKQVQLFGFYIERYVPDLSILRRLASSAVSLISEKGTCKGIEDFIKVLTLWDVTCTVFGASNCLTTYLKTWDGQVEKQTLSYLSSTVEISPGLIQFPDSILDPGFFDEGVLIDSMGEKYHILSNQSDQIVLENSTDQIVIEDIIVIESVVALGGLRYRLTLSRTFYGPSDTNSNEYAGYQILDVANTLMDVVGTLPGDPIQVFVISSSIPALGQGVVAPFYIQGGDLESREPQLLLDLYSGCPSFLWDSRRNLDLYTEGGDSGPFNTLFSGGLLKGNSLLPGDFVITVKAGVAECIGTITSLFMNTFEDTDAALGELSNYLVNPNRNQKGLFPIDGNTEQQITAKAIFDAQISVSDVAKEGSNYFVLSLYNAALYNMVVRVLGLMTDRRCFIFFE